MLKKARTTGLALLAVGALVVAGCGDDKEKEAQEQVNSALSQANAAQSQAGEAQSQALSQAAEIQSSAQDQVASQLDAITQGLDDLTATEAVVPEVTTEAVETEAPAETTEAELPTEPAETAEATDTVAASGDIIAPEDLKAVLEEATGVTLGDLAGAAGPGGAGYSNQATMITDGQAVFAYVLTDPQAAQAFSSLVPQIPGVAGSATVAHKNVIVVYASFGQTDRSKEVEAAVKAL